MEDLSVSYWKVAFAVVYDYYFDDLFLVFEALKTKATHCHYRLQWRTNCCFDGTTAMMVKNPYLLSLDIGKSQSYALFGLPHIDKMIGVNDKGDAAWHGGWSMVLLVCFVQKM